MHRGTAGMILVLGSIRPQDRDETIETSFCGIRRTIKGTCL